MRFLVLLVVIAVVLARTSNRGSRGGGCTRNGGTPGNFDYYVLSMSYAPNFCGDKQDDGECDPNKNFGLVLHGLWPSYVSGKWPQCCVQSSYSSRQLTNSYPSGWDAIAPEYGTLGVHEWERHGTCDGKNEGPKVFFAKAFNLAKDYVTHGALPTDSAGLANAIQPNGQIHYYNDGSLQEIHWCFDRKLNPADCDCYDSGSKNCLLK